MYNYELHCHTGTVSRCASIDPKALVRRYADAGYDGIVLTDHFSPMTFLGGHFFAPQKDLDFYLSSYHTLKAYCGSAFPVLLGLELRHYGTVNDYLVYGVDERWLRRQGNLLLWDERTMSRNLHDAGCLVYQAHPYRPFITRCDPALLDGIEVFNGHTDERANYNALLWAQSNSMPMISGSDTHHETDRICGGIRTETAIRTNEDLLDVLRTQSYTLITDGDRPATHALTLERIGTHAQNQTR